MIQKAKINVIDLDKTLIAYDSFRGLIIQELKTFNSYIIYITTLRVLRLISGTKYKRRTSLYFEKKYNENYFIEYANKLYKDIDQRVLDKIKLDTDDETINILLTASPNFFAKHLIKKLKWSGSGSYFDNKDNYIHLYGEEKIKWLDHKFNPYKFDYNFAISDSSSDDKLLSLFKRKVKWKI